MSYKHSNGNKRRLADYPENGRNRTALDDQESLRKRRRNSSEKSAVCERVVFVLFFCICTHILKEHLKKPRKDRNSDDDHLIDSKYPEWHDKDGHFNYRAGESLGDQLDSSEPGISRNFSLSKGSRLTFRSSKIQID